MPELLRQARDPDGVLRRAAPAERARHEHVQVARPANLHRRLNLRLEVAQLRDGGRRDVGDLVRHRDQRGALALTEDVARLRADGLCRRRARRRGRRTRALHAGVHVGLVVVTDVEHVVAALEHARQARHADVDRAAVAALADDAHVLAPLRLQRGRDARRDGRRVAEQRVDPRDPPRGLRVGGGEDLQAAGRVGRDHLPVARAHRGVEGVARAERLTAALTGSMTAGDRIGALLVGLQRALLGVEQTIADREAAGLVEADRRGLHPRAPLIPVPRRPCRRRAGCSRHVARRRPRPACARARARPAPSPCRGS